MSIIGVIGKVLRGPLSGLHRLHQRPGSDQACGLVRSAAREIPGRPPDRSRAPHWRARDRRPSGPRGRPCGLARSGMRCTRPSVSSVRTRWVVAPGVIRQRRLSSPAVRLCSGAAASSAASVSRPGWSSPWPASTRSRRVTSAAASPSNGAVIRAGPASSRGPRPPRRAPVAPPARRTLGHSQYFSAEISPRGLTSPPWGPRVHRFRDAAGPTGWWSWWALLPGALGEQPAGLPQVSARRTSPPTRSGPPSAPASRGAAGTRSGGGPATSGPATAGPWPAS